MVYYMNSELSKLNTKGRRYLKKERLALRYSPEEMQELLKSYSYDVPIDVSQMRWSARFDELTKAARSHSPRLIRRWSPEEDAFLRDTYMYLTDHAIALALNIPSNIVLSRRKVLKLSKSYSNNLEVIVWCERDSFVEDVEKRHLLKARPDVII